MTVAGDCHTGFTPRAVEEVQRCRDHIARLRMYGEAEERRAAVSFANALAQMIGLGGTITADGDMGLYTVTAYGMHVGMVFHPDRTETAAERIAHNAGSDAAYVATLLTDTANPTPGEWSCHS